MSKSNIGNFDGFSKESFLFLHNLKNNNNKPWFEEHKSDYEQFLLIPLKQLVASLELFILNIDDNLGVKPVINKTISRIYRDTRFSKYKSPFKSRMWLTFKPYNKNWKTLPAFFFEIQSDGYSYGMGLFKAEPSYMEKYRYSISQNEKAFLDIVSLLEKSPDLLIGGRDYKKNFYQGESDKIKSWYQKRGLFVVRSRAINKAIFSNQLVTDIQETFTKLTPLYKYLRDVQKIEME